MGRIRTIKPEFFMHEGLFDAEHETGLPLRVAFAGLWTACDKAGRFEWRPRALKAAILPYDEVDFSRVLDALTTRGFVRQYTVAGKDFGEVPSFGKHQVINNRERESDIPEPPHMLENKEDLTREPHVDDASPTRLEHAQVEGEGERERKGKEEEEAQAPAPPPDKPSDIAACLEAWASPGAVTSFIAYRRKTKGKALTLTAAKRLAENLKAIFDGGGNTDDALGMAEERGWQTIQPDWYFNAKKRQANGNGQYPTGDRGERFQRIIAAAAEGSPGKDWG